MAVVGLAQGWFLWVLGFREVDEEMKGILCMGCKFQASTSKELNNNLLCLLSLGQQDNLPVLVEGRTMLCMLLAELL